MEKLPTVIIVLGSLFTIAHCFSTHKEILQGFDVALAAAKAELEKVLEIS